MAAPAPAAPLVLKDFYALTGKAKPASFLKPRTDDPAGSFKLVEGQKLVSNITDSTISARLIRANREKDALETPAAYMQKKIAFLAVMREIVSQQIIAIYDAIQTDKDGKELMTPLEARDIARKYGEKLSQILVDDVLEAVYPSGESVAAENLTKEIGLGDSYTKARRNARRNK